MRVHGELAFARDEVTKYFSFADISKTRADTLDIAEYVFSAIFIAEAMVKIVAYGFVLHPESYLRSPWNVMDVIIVIAAYVGSQGVRHHRILSHACTHPPPP